MKYSIIILLICLSSILVDSINAQRRSSSRSSRSRRSSTTTRSTTSHTVGRRGDVSRGSAKMGLIIGFSVVGGLLLLVGIFFLVICCIKNRKYADPPTQTQNPAAATQINPVTGEIADKPFEPLE